MLLFWELDIPILEDTKIAVREKYSNSKEQEGAFFIFHSIRYIRYITK